MRSSRHIETHVDSRIVFINIETTGVSIKNGDRIVEIAAIEYAGNRPSGSAFHIYINPEREVAKDAQSEHGLSLEFLKDKPRFSEIADNLQAFLKGATVVTHAASFTIPFLDYEFSQVDKPRIAEYCIEIIDTLRMAKKLRPGKNGSLNALIIHYDINQSRGSGTLADTGYTGEIYFSLKAETPTQSLGQPSETSNT